MQNSAMPDLSTAWTLSDAAEAFIALDDKTAIAHLDEQIEEISDRLMWLRAGDFDPWPDEDLMLIPGFDFVGITTEEEDERKALGWTSERIQKWMISRHIWVRAAVYHSSLISKAELVERGLREDWTEASAKTAIDEAIARRCAEMETDLDHLRRRRRDLASKGLRSALKGGSAVAYARAGSIGEPIARLTPKTWNNDELVFDPNRRAVARLGDDQAIVFCDVKVLPAVPMAPKQGRQRTKATIVRQTLDDLDLLYTDRSLPVKTQLQLVRAKAMHNGHLLKEKDMTNGALEQAINRARKRAKADRAAGVR